MNRISVEMLLEIERLAYDEGLSIREIADATGCNKMTVSRYFPRDARCKCGKLSISHRGWCSFRYARSADRPAVIVKAHAAQKAKRDAMRQMKEDAARHGMVWRGGRWEAKTPKQ